MTNEEWDTVIGLEVHAELATESKMFSPARNRFGGEPNTNIHPVCLGLPGTLPVVNEKAIELGIRVGLALNCSINRCVFARKNYFYPDMPKDYQISQYDRPLNTDGFVDLPNGTRIRVERAHLEEDTGKSTHIGTSGRITGADYSLVDYNRAGVPLLEIVSHPDLRNADDAKSYVQELRAALVAVGASDGKMEEGSLRVDANVSVRPAGSDELRTRCEIKNVNSLRSLGRAIEYEAKRHIQLYENGERPIQETRHWDEEAGRTQPGRSKEEADDYRYFDDPDLVVVAPSDEWIDEIRAALPKLPAELRAEWIDAGADPELAGTVISRGLGPLVAGAISDGADLTTALNHAANNIDPENLGQLTARGLAETVRMEVGGQLTSTQAKVVLRELIDNGGTAAQISEAKGFEAMDAGELEAMLDQVILDSPDEWARFCDGEAKLQGFFTGQLMKATRGQADGKVINQLLQEKKNA